MDQKNEVVVKTLTADEDGSKGQVPKWVGTGRDEDMPKRVRISCVLYQCLEK